MPKLVVWEKCCGCGACATVCPKIAISMLPNEEGFLHPVIDNDLCVECKACEKACPGLAPAKAENNTPLAFIVQHKDDYIRYESTSGGAFTAIAGEIIRRGGVVYGAVVTDSLTIKHEAVSTNEDLARFRNSKYVQSEIGDCYKDARKRLSTGQVVCFSGTPCQINGLYKYLGKDYDNLISVDIVCKSVPSPLVFQKYVEYKKKKEGNISDIVFRDKKRGFLYCTMAHYLSHEDRKNAKDVYRRGSESDEWLRLFLSGKISRHSCMTCQFQTLDRVGDFTLGDIWETGHPELDDNKGSTLVHIWTEKGKAFFESIKQDVRFVEYPIEKSRGAVRISNCLLSDQRKSVFSDVHSLSARDFFLKYAPNTVKIRLKEAGRFIIWRLKLHNFVRHIKHTILHKDR